MLRGISLSNLRIISFSKRSPPSDRANTESVQDKSVLSVSYASTSAWCHVEIKVLQSSLRKQQHGC